MKTMTPGLRWRNTALLGMLALLTVPPGARAAEEQEADSKDAVVRELSAMRKTLQEISVLLDAAVAQNEISALMTRIQLKERRIEPEERALRGARDERRGILEERKRLEGFEEQVNRDLRKDDAQQEEGLERQLREIQREFELVDLRAAALDQRILEMENGIARQRDDILILEEMVDEALGLR